MQHIPCFESVFESSISHVFKCNFLYVQYILYLVGGTCFWVPCIPYLWLYSLFEARIVLNSSEGKKYLASDHMDMLIEPEDISSFDDFSNFLSESDTL